MQVLPRAAMLFKTHQICRDGNSRYYESKSNCTLLAGAEALTGKPFRATETEYVPRSMRDYSLLYLFHKFGQEKLQDAPQRGTGFYFSFLRAFIMVCFKK